MINPVGTDAQPGRFVPMLTAMSALALSCAAIATYVGFALVLGGLEESVNASGRASGIGVVIAAVLSVPAAIMAGGAILMIRRRAIGRILISVTAALATVVMSVLIVGSILGGDFDPRMMIVAAAPITVLLLSNSSASKEWTGGGSGRRIPRLNRP